MPYISRQGLTNQVELWTGHNDYLTVTNVAADKAFSGTITVPGASTLRGAIASAYLDLYIPSVQNYNVAENYIESLQYIKISKNATDYYNAIQVYSWFLHCIGATSSSNWWVYGNIDISNRFSKGDTLNFIWAAADAHVDGFYLWTPQIRLRIYQTLSGTA